MAAENRFHFLTRFSNEKRDFTLSGSNIDSFAEWITEEMKKLGVERQNRIRIRLSMEEALLRIRDRFGEEQVVTALLTMRFGQYSLQLEVVGDAYNLLSSRDEKLGDLCGSLLTAVQLLPQYNYVGQRNILRIALPVQRWNPGFRVLLALLIGLLIGTAGRMLVPDALLQVYAPAASEPVFESWWHILNVVSGPVMFFMVITSILNMGKFVEFGGNQTRVTMRYLVLSLLTGIVTITVSTIIYQPVFENEPFWSELMAFIPQIFPNDILSPLINFNTIQLLLIAGVLGNIVNRLGNSAKSLSSLLEQFNLVGMEAAGIISNLAPWVIFILFFLDIWQGNLRLFIGLWGCLLISLGFSILLLVISLLFICRREKVTLSTLLKKVSSPFKLALRTGSLDDAYGETLHSCINGLGIQRRLAEMSLPHGLIYYMPLCVIGTIVCINYLAVQYQIPVTPFWYLYATILTVLLSVASPPVPGVGIITYSVLFQQLGVPTIALTEAMVFDILFNTFAAAGNQLILQLELILQADRLGLLNRETLRKAH